MTRRDCGREATVFNSLVDRSIRANRRHKKNPKQRYALGVLELCCLTLGFWAGRRVSGDIGVPPGSAFSDQHLIVRRADSMSLRATYVAQGLILGASASLASFSQLAARANQNARSRALMACLAIWRALSAPFAELWVYRNRASLRSVTQSAVATGGSASEWRPGGRDAASIIAHQFYSP